MSFGADAGRAEPGTAEGRMPGIGAAGGRAAAERSGAALIS